LVREERAQNVSEVVSGETDFDKFDLLRRLWELNWIRVYDSYSIKSEVPFD
jgi:hypothetical protein